MSLLLPTSCDIYYTAIAQINYIAWKIYVFNLIVSVLIVSDPLQVNRTVTSLDIAKNKFGDRDVEYIARGLSLNDVITRLDMSCNDVSIEGAQMLGYALRKAKC